MTHPGCTGNLSSNWMECRTLVVAVAARTGDRQLWEGRWRR